MNRQKQVSEEILIQALLAAVGAVVAGWFYSNSQMAQALVVFLCAVVLALMVHFWKPLRRALQGVLHLLGEVCRGVLWFFAGNYLIMDRLYYPLTATVQSSLITTFFLTEKVTRWRQELCLVFSHRPMQEQDDESLRLLHNQLDENYQVAPYPVDEAPFIMRTWHHLASAINWGSIHLLCSCQAVIDESILQQNLIIVGSNHYNKVWEIVQFEAVKRNWLDYVMVLDRENKECYLTKEYGPRVPEREFRPRRSTKSEAGLDYGLVVRMPNPLNQSSSVFVFAGCHRASQIAITEWFLRPDELMTLIKRYVGSTSFQLILAQEYMLPPKSLAPILKGYPRIVYEKTLDRV